MPAAKTEKHPMIPGARRRIRKSKAPVLRSIDPPSVPPRKDPLKAIKVLEAKADEKRVIELTSVTAAELEEVKKVPGKAMSTEEKLAVLEMYQKQYSEQVIAARVGRSPLTIRKFLTDYKPTTVLAKAVFEAKAEQLAYRIVKHGDVDQSLEVMDRLGVLKRNIKDAGGTSNNFQVIVGMPGKTSGAPAIDIPSQSEVLAIARNDQD